MITDFISFIKYSSSSLITTGLDLVIYTVIADYLDPYISLDLFVATIIARLFSDSAKYFLDKKAVFYSNEKHGYVKYLLLAGGKTLCSATLVTIIGYFINDYETVIKMIVDSCLFVPGFFISKIWVHKVK